MTKKGQKRAKKGPKKGQKRAKKGPKKSQMSKELQLYWNHSCHCNHQLKRNKTNRAVRALELVISHMGQKKGAKVVQKGLIIGE